MWFFQVVMALFAAFMLYVLRIHYSKRYLGAGEFGAWVVVWFGFIGFSLFPSALRGVADILHIGRVFDLLVILALAILTTVVIVNRTMSLAQEEKIEKLVRLLALNPDRLDIEKGDTTLTKHAGTNRAKNKKQKVVR